MKQCNVCGLRSTPVPALLFLLHQRTLPPHCLDFLHHHLPFPARKSEHQPQENVSQARPSICLCHWHPQGAPTVRRWQNLVPGAGQMASHPPVTALRILKPALGFLSETRAAHEPSSPMPMAIYPACDAMPTHKLGEMLPQLDSLCHLPVVTLH